MVQMKYQFYHNVYLTCVLFWYVGGNVPPLAKTTAHQQPTPNNQNKLLCDRQNNHGPSGVTTRPWHFTSPADAMVSKHPPSTFWWPVIIVTALTIIVCAKMSYSSHKSQQCTFSCRHPHIWSLPKFIFRWIFYLGVYRSITIHQYMIDPGSTTYIVVETEIRSRNVHQHTVTYSSGESKIHQP